MPVISAAALWRIESAFGPNESKSLTRICLVLRSAIIIIGNSFSAFHAAQLNAIVARNIGQAIAASRGQLHVRYVAYI